MKSNANSYKYRELLKWYRKPANFPIKKLFNDQVSRIKEHAVGNNVLYVGLSDFKQKFKSAKHLSYIAIDEINSPGDVDPEKKFPFEDNSHDVIIIIHALDYTDNPHQIVREIDRIATDDAKVVLVGFNKSSIWGLVKPLMNNMNIPWSLNFHSLYGVKEWFKLLGYESVYKETGRIFPFISKNFSKLSGKIKIFQKLYSHNFGGIYFCVFSKNIIPLTAIKLKFKNKYLVAPFPKSSLNRVK